DIVEGQAGSDSLLFNGANIAERIDISANGGRVRFTRDIASITMDLNSVETITFRALGGIDVVTVNDMSGTGLTQVNFVLGANGGGGDGAADQLIANGTVGNDTIAVASAGGTINVTGLAASIAISNAEANDSVVIEGGAGSDTAVVNGGTGADT